MKGQLGLYDVSKIIIRKYITFYYVVENLCVILNRSSLRFFSFDEKFCVNEFRDNVFKWTTGAHLVS